MIRILHFADLHLGVENYSHTDPATGLSSCLSDFLATLDEVVEFALDQDIDLVLFCGDAYKSRDPSQTQQREFAKRVARLVNGGIPVFLLVGNHDLPNAIGRATAVEIFDTLAVRNVIVANRPDTHLVETKGGLVQVVALPWIRRSDLLTREEAKNLTLEEVNARIAETLTNILALKINGTDPHSPAILAAHVHLANAEFGSERTLTVGREPVLLQSSVADPAFDYVALGHIHKRQVLSYAPPLVYSGSLQRIDFGEEEDTKGFYLVEIDPSKNRGERVNFDFHEVAARRFLTIRVSISPSDLNPTAVILKAIAQRSEEAKNAIVRVRLALPERSEGLIQEREIYRALSEAQWVTIVREVEREHRVRLSNWLVEGKSPIEALQAYLEAEKTYPDRTQVLLEYGRKLIQEKVDEVDAPAGLEP